MFTVYILYSSDIDKYYVGYASDVNTRLRRHLSSHRGYTNRAKDWKIVYVEVFETKQDAYRRERQIKKWKSRLKIEDLIRKSKNLD